MNLPPILDSCIFILILCLLPIAMNSSPSGHRAEDGHAPNHNRPFFFQPMSTPHMFAPPVSHFMHPPAFHPYFYPTVEFGGGLYYPVCPMPYPRSYGPQSPMTHTNYRRPYFNSSFVARPTFYHSTRFRNYPFRRNVTNTEVQTDTNETHPGHTKRADVVAETAACSSQTAEIRVQKSSGIESASGSADVLAQERILHKGIRDEPNETEETSATVAVKSAKPGGYAFQKEKIRIECSEGAPSINVWRSFEATVPIYNTTPNNNNKAEDRIQCEVWSVSACESGVPFYGSFEADKMIQKTDVPKECTTSPTPQEMRLDSNKGPERGRESEAKGDPVPRCAATLGKVDTLPCKTETRKLPTHEFIHEASEKPARQRCQSGIVHKNGIEEKNETRNEKNDHQIISLESLNEEKICEVLKSDGSLESVEEYVPSASVLAWLQNQARSYRWKNGLPQTMRDRPRVLDGSFEEMSSKDEESSFDFFDAMPARNQVSYSHLMSNPPPPPSRQARSASSAQSGSKSLENQHVPEREKIFCSACQRETLLKAKSEKPVACRNHSANRNVGSDALSERDYLSKDQLICGNSVAGGRRKCRRISRESCSSNKKKTRYSSDSEQASEDQDNHSRAGRTEKVKVDTSSRKKIVRRPSKHSALQIANRPQQEKPKGKKGLAVAKYTVNQREQNRVGNEHNERQKSGQTAKPERKRKEEEKRRKCTRKAMSVQNESEESVDEYWNKVGAKPKSATRSLGDAEDEKLQQKVKTICKSVPHKRGTREFNEMETWDSSCLHGFQGNALRRGRTKKKMLKNSHL